MDAKRFDALAQLLGSSSSRRGAIAGLAALLPALEVAGKGKHKHRKHRGKERRREPKRVQAQAEPCFPGTRCTPKKGANLSRCDLSGSTAFTGLDCTGCNLSYANLHGVTATGANFTRANLSYSCLVDADLTGATIAGNTNTSFATFCRTKMPNGSVNNSGCGLGTDCCAACDAQHPCGAGKLCCHGRCVTGDCCERSECADQSCRTKDCQNFHCTYAVATDGSPCDDGDACTRPDTCQGGVCVSGSPLVCLALDECHVPGTCNPTTGSCSNPKAADGTACTTGGSRGKCADGDCVSCRSLTEHCDNAGQCCEGACEPSRPSGDTICCHPYNAACQDTDECCGTRICGPQSKCCLGSFFDLDRPQPGSCVGREQECCPGRRCNPLNGACCVVEGQPVPPANQGGVVDCCHFTEENGVCICRNNGEACTAPLGFFGPSSCCDGLSCFNGRCEPQCTPLGCSPGGLPCCGGLTCRNGACLS